jgi:hypothetical protein
MPSLVSNRLGQGISFGEPNAELGDAALGDLAALPVHPSDFKVEAELVAGELYFKLGNALGPPAAEGAEFVADRHRPFCRPVLESLYEMHADEQTGNPFPHHVRESMCVLILPPLR